MSGHIPQCKTCGQRLADPPPAEHANRSGSGRHENQSRHAMEIQDIIQQHQGRQQPDGAGEHHAHAMQHTKHAGLAADAGDRIENRTMTARTGGELRHIDLAACFGAAAQAGPALRQTA